MEKQIGVTWAELKTWAKEQGIKDDDLLGYWDFYFPKGLEWLKVSRGDMTPGSGLPGLHVTQKQ